MLLALAALSSAGYDGRALHWVIRVSNLEETLTFVKEVLGMHILRHEENEAACPITCNGKYETPWSKTMVGYAPEDKSYALELTYNYGIGSYVPGQGLQRFVLSLPDAAKKRSKAKELGFALSGASAIIGPDGYTYDIRDSASLPEEPFTTVVLRSPDAEALAAWYHEVLGMEKPRAAGAEACAPGVASCIEVGYGGARAIRFLMFDDGVTPTIQQWEGRNAIALPEQQVRAINARVLRDAPELVVHEMQELNEKLGILVIVILKDPVVGYELCLVSSETFDPSVKAATDYSVPDWTKRAEVLATATAEAAASAKDERPGIHDEL